MIDLTHYITTFAASPLTPGDVRVRIGSRMHETNCAKFGALIGDHARIGANAVIAPGALLQRGAVVARAALLDHEAGWTE